MLRNIRNVKHWCDHALPVPWTCKRLMSNSYMEGVNERLERDLLISANCQSIPVQLSSGSRDLLVSLSQQEARIASHLLLDTNTDDLPDISTSSHPAIQLFRRFAQYQQQPDAIPSTQRLLIALMAEHINSKYPDLATERMRDAQRQVSEIVQLLHVSQLLHRRLLDLDREHEHESEDPEVQSINPIGIVDQKDPLHRGNKLAVLGGDLLFTLAVRLMADLRNQSITEYVTSTTEKQALASFALHTGTLTSEALSLPFPVGLRVWARLQLQISVCNLQNGCRSLVALLPPDTPDIKLVRSCAVQFARHFGFALQSVLERHRVLKSMADVHARVPLMSAPVLMDGNRLNRLLDTTRYQATVNSQHLIPYFDDCTLPKSKQFVHTCTRKASQCLNTISTKDTPLHHLLEAINRF